MDKGLALAWFDWKRVAEVIDALDQMTETGPLCFRVIEQDKEDEELGYLDDNYYFVVSKQPISKKAAKAFYRQEMAKRYGAQADNRS